MAYYVSSGQVSSGIILTNNSMYVSSGGVANELTIKSGGSLVFSGGTVTGADVSGTVLISSGCMSDLSVSSGATVKVFADGNLNSVTVYSGGSLILSSGATIGMLDCRPVAVVSALSGSILQAAIDKTTQVDRPMFSHFASVTGEPEYRIDVRDTSLCGTYLLTGYCQIIAKV